MQAVLSKIMENEKPYTKIGVGVMIFKEGKVLLGKRKGSYAYGEYASPGGHLEYLESFEDCARRETLEEAGIEIENIRFQFLANVNKYHPKHYVHVNLIADWKSGEPKTMEPDKCEGWAWYDLNNLPKPLFEFEEIFFDSHRTGKNYYDAVS
ncbi:MAG: NUDIX domain-containing protein [Candidatus Wildermuthbacteria bacterium]|nr:NUDIX domain-containing protein [Candidatus Wildermuthbacteria bacterium]